MIFFQLFSKVSNAFCSINYKKERVDIFTKADFTIPEYEAAPVIKVLAEQGIEAVAVHNHMVHETPEVFFLHY